MATLAGQRAQFTWGLNQYNLSEDPDTRARFAKRMRTKRQHGQQGSPAVKSSRLPEALRASSRHADLLTLPSRAG